MNKTRSVAIIGMYTALLIGAQFILSTVSGIEIVTVLLLCFCFVFGSKKGVYLATAFSLTRCLFFGFQFNIVILYLVYYNLFALFFGYFGKKLPQYKGMSHLLVVVFACMFTVFFTVFDNIFTPLFFGFTLNAAKAYFFASLYTVIPQTICTAVTVTVFFRPLTSILSRLKSLKNT